MGLPALILFSALSAVTVLAAAEDDGLALGERSPGEITVEERAQMIRATNMYNNCVYKQATDNINSAPDIRLIAERALRACQAQLSGLQDLIHDWKFPAYFAYGYTRAVRARAARNILAELATGK